MQVIPEELERFGKGVGNVVRIRMLEALLNGEKSVGELVKIARRSQPAVSQHLRTLKAGKIVRAQRRGQEVYYAVNARYAREVLQRLLWLFSRQLAEASRHRR